MRRLIKDRPSLNCTRLSVQRQVQRRSKAEIPRRINIILVTVAASKCENGKVGDGRDRVARLGGVCIGIEHRHFGKSLVAGRRGSPIETSAAAAAAPNKEAGPRNQASDYYVDRLLCPFPRRPNLSLTTHRHAVQIRAEVFRLRREAYCFPACALQRLQDCHDRRRRCSRRQGQRPRGTAYTLSSLSRVAAAGGNGYVQTLTYCSVAGRG